jgi:catechol 2,3-dioxygenase-like lactoylglutathione lyase family enzyme
MALVKRIHIAINVSSLREADAFYTRLLDAVATKKTSDQIDWVIDNPPVHFSLFSNDPSPGIDHFGFAARPFGPHFVRRDSLRESLNLDSVPNPS